MAQFSTLPVTYTYIIINIQKTIRRLSRRQRTIKSENYVVHPYTFRCYIITLIDMHAFIL